jgi:hypothetical protein
LQDIVKVFLKAKDARCCLGPGALGIYEIRTRPMEIDQ